jgi:hypothetical protein
MVRKLIPFLALLLAASGCAQQPAPNQHPHYQPPIGEPCLPPGPC